MVYAINNRSIDSIVGEDHQGVMTICLKAEQVPITVVSVKAVLVIANQLKFKMQKKWSLKLFCYYACRDYSSVQV